MILSKTTLLFFFAFRLIAINSAAAQETSNGPLQLTIVAVRSTSNNPLFSVELHNHGDHPLVLNLGFMGANGKKQYPDAIHLVLKDSSGKTFPLDLIGPAIATGRVDPLVVPLPEGATFVLPINLQNYYSPKNKIWKLDLSPGRYNLNAEFRGESVSQKQANPDMEGFALMPYWTGTLNSNTLPFTFSKGVASKGSIASTPLEATRGVIGAESDKKPAQRAGFL
jgi:hypothetical protein